jgi:hypothetical protein
VKRGDDSLIVGLYHAGPFPAQNWIEVAFWGSTDPQEEQSLVRLLAQVIPPGGHLMVEYESEQRKKTERALVLGVPPVLTPLGWQLYQAGCGVAQRDWHFPEGGREGPRKLQGFRAMDEEDARQKREAMLAEVQRFLERTAKQGQIGPEVARARERARRVLAKLG